jgi:hypothetical protein
MICSCPFALIEMSRAALTELPLPIQALVSMLTTRTVIGTATPTVPPMASEAATSSS